ASLADYQKNIKGVDVYYINLLEELSLGLFGEVNDGACSGLNRALSKHEIVKMFNKNKTYIECSWAAGDSDRHGTMKHECVQCHLECVNAHFHRLFRL
ncbi:hypothetical protein LSAT2_015989, partial [Lamellibrachia satsuma]